MKKILTLIKTHPVSLYPIILITLLVLLSALKISGTSIGEYHSVLYGQNTKDPSLVAGAPREIRSDEWLVITQAIIAQKEAGFPQFNTNFNGGQDMSLLTDAPYLEWSVLFKPQHFAFFVLPLENAFAFKWWFLLVLLALSTYFLCLRIVPKNIPFAIAMSIVAACSPFVFWWYQSTTVLSLAYGTLIVLIGMSMIDQKPLRLLGNHINKRNATILKVAALSYVLAAFALILYPPFQIPVAIVGGLFLVGYFIKAASHKPKKFLWALAVPFLISAVIAGAICGAFVATRADVVHTISNTAYPGKRTVPSGGYDINHLLTTYLQPQLVNNDRQTQYYSNQSETSSFILLPLFFILPLIYILTVLYIKKKKIEWPAIGLLIANFVLLCHLFVPGADLLSKLFLLHIVPIERAIIGLGFAGVLTVMYITKLLSDMPLKKKQMIIIAVYSLIGLAIAIYCGLQVRDLYPEFIVSRKLLVLYAVIVYGGMALILFKKAAIGALILAAFSIFAVYQIHPLYKGLGPLYNGALTSTIKDLSTKDDVWAVAEDVRFESLPQLSNRQAVTGVAFYPNIDFWDDYSNDATTYNRYAHIVLDKKIQQPILLVQKDIFVVSPRCNQKLAKHIDYILSAAPIEQSCLTLVKTIPYPEKTFYIYRENAQ